MVSGDIHAKRGYNRRVLPQLAPCEYTAGKIGHGYLSIYPCYGRLKVISETYFAKARQIEQSGVINTRNILYRFQNFRYDAILGEESHVDQKLGAQITVA